MKICYENLLIFWRNDKSADLTGLLCLLSHKTEKPTKKPKKPKSNKINSADARELWSRCQHCVMNNLEKGILEFGKATMTDIITKSVQVKDSRQHYAW